MKVSDRRRGYEARRGHACLFSPVACPGRVPCRPDAMRAPACSLVARVVTSREGRGEGARDPCVMQMNGPEFLYYDTLRHPQRGASWRSGV